MRVIGARIVSELVVVMIYWQVISILCMNGKLRTVYKSSKASVEKWIIIFITRSKELQTINFVAISCKQ